MCCIFSCCVWTLDIIQRVLTFLLACILVAMVLLILAVAIVVGIAYGYNYSMAEFISLGKSDVTVYMRRGQFSDTGDKDADRPPVFAERRRFEDVFPDGSAIDINKLIPDAAGEARVLADSWEQAKDARRYDSILSKFTARRVKPKKASKATRSSLMPHTRVMNSQKSLLFDEENQDNDNIYTESEKITTKITKNSPSIMEKFKPIYIEEDNQNKYQYQEETIKSDIVTAKTIKNWPSTERRTISNINKKFVEEKTQDKYIFYNKTTKSKGVTVEQTKNEKQPDIKIRVGSIDYEIPEEEKYKILEQSPDGNDDSNETEEEDRIVKSIQEEANRLRKYKVQQTNDVRIPDVKIRLGNINYHTTTEKIKTTRKPRLKTGYTEKFKTRIPDIKIRVDSKDYYKSDKNNKKTIVEPNEQEDYEEQFDRKTLNERFQNIDSLKFDGGATRHPYKMHQPPHLYREEDDDVMYKPV